MKKLVEADITESVLIVLHTTSKKCKETEMTAIQDENGNYRPLKVTFGSRTCANKCLYCVYKVLKCFYTSLFFYFLPFSTIILTCFIPIISRYTAGHSADTALN